METNVSSPQPQDPGNVNEQLERINNKIVELKSLHRAARGQTLLMGILILLIAGCMIWEMIQPFRELSRDSGVILKALEEQASIMYPILRQELARVFEKLVPAYKEALQVEMGWRRGMVENSLHSEFNLFVGSLQAYFSKQGEVRMNHFIESYRKRMVKDFPDLEKDEAKLAQIEEALHGAFNTVVGTHFQKHFDYVTNIRETFQNLPVPPQIKNMTEDQLQEHILETAAKIINDKIKPALDLWHKVSQRVTAMVEQVADISEVLEQKAVHLSVPQKTPRTPKK